MTTKSADDAKARLAKSKSEKHWKYVTDPKKVREREIIAAQRLQKIRFEDEPMSQADIGKSFAEADAILSGGFAALSLGVLRHPDLSPRDIVTAGFMLHYARDDSTTHVSELTLGKDMRCGLTAVKDSLNGLAAAHLIVIEERALGRSNVYDVTALRNPILTAERGDD